MNFLEPAVAAMIIGLIHVSRAVDINYLPVAALLFMIARGRMNQARSRKAIGVAVVTLRVVTFAAVWHMSIF